MLIPQQQEIYLLLTTTIQYTSLTTQLAFQHSFNWALHLHYNTLMSNQSKTKSTSSTVKEYECWPIDNAITMKEHQRQGDLSWIETWSWLIKLPSPLNLKHQISTTYILHYEEQSILKPNIQWISSLFDWVRGWAFWLRPNTNLSAQVWS